MAPGDKTHGAGGLGNSGIDPSDSSSGMAFGFFQMCPSEAALFCPCPWRPTLGLFILLLSFGQGSRRAALSPHGG